MKKTNLTKNRVPIEGNFVLSLYKNPTDLYEDFPINPDRDLITADGKFYYNLGANMLKKGIKTFDEISVLTFLNDYPEIKNEFENKGGWKAVSEYTGLLDEENVDAYYNELMKNNLLLELDKKGFNIDANLNIFNQLKFKIEIKSKKIQNKK